MLSIFKVLFRGVHKTGCDSPVRAVHRKSLYIVDGYKDRIRYTVLHLFPSSLALSNLHHCQRVHKLYRGYELRSACFLLGKLEDEHNLQGNVWFAVVKRAVGNCLRGRPSSVLSHPSRRVQGASWYVAHLERDGTRIIDGVEDFELDS